MTREWKRGDERAFRYADYDPDLDIRPLVVIDPENREQVERLAQTYRDAFWGQPDDVPVTRDHVDSLQAALREFANPTQPKPEEPQGLGAVVEDAEGRQWVNVGAARYPWHHGAVDEDGDTYVDAAGYDDLTVVRVLSEGVS